MFRRLAIILLLAAPTLPQAASSSTTAKRPFTFEDMMKLKRLEEPVLSPDGKWVIFAAVDVNLEQNTKTPHIWIVPLAGGESRQLTNDSAGEDRPRFSPDGKQIAYISSKDGTSQIWLVGFDTATGQLAGEPHQLTHISTEADGEIWSPDGKSLVFISHVFPDCPDDACNKQRQDALTRSKVKAEIFTHLFFRHWNEYTDFKNSHLFVASATTGEAKDITPGPYDVPPFSLGGPDDYDISPDSQELAYTSNHDAVPAASTNNDIWLVPMSCAGTPAEGNCAPKKISTSPGSDSTPRYSPDGKWIAWRMQKRAGYESDKFNLVVYDRKSGGIKNLTDDFDRWVGTYVWSPDSKTIYLSAEIGGESPIFALDMSRPDLTAQDVGSNEKITLPVTGFRGYDDDLTMTRDGKTLLFSEMSVSAPTEIYKIQPANGEPICDFPIPGVFDSGIPRCGTSQEKPSEISHINDAQLDQFQMPPLEAFWFTGAHNERVEGFLLKPPNFDPSRKYPVKFIVHGGPEVPMGDEWSYRWNEELFAARGYVVITIAFHGTPGYGQKFIDAIDGDWGGAPFQDLMLGLDYAEQHFSFIDKNRECALGASYGGYMIDWIAGHTTRFKCLVTHDGMSDTEAGYGQTEEMWFPEWEFKGTPWTNRETYRKWNPILAAPNFHTPTLIVHGQKDYRLDVAQGFEFFTTLQRLGVPSKMLYFPDEGHWVLKPQNSQLWWKTVNDWVDEWVGKPASSDQQR